MLWARVRSSCRSRGSSHGSRYSQLGANPHGSRRQRQGKRKYPDKALSLSQNPPAATRREGPGERQLTTPKVWNACWEWERGNPNNLTAWSHARRAFLSADRRGSHASGSPKIGRASHPFAAPVWVSSQTERAASGGVTAPAYPGQLQNPLCPAGRKGSPLAGLRPDTCPRPCGVGKCPRQLGVSFERFASIRLPRQSKPSAGSQPWPLADNLRKLRLLWIVSEDQQQASSQSLRSHATFGIVYRPRATVACDLHAKAKQKRGQRRRATRDLPAVL